MIFDFTTLEHRLREMAFLNKGLKITLEDKRKENKKFEEFHYEGGIKEFVAFQNKHKEAIHPDIIYFEVEGKDSTGKGDMSLEVAIQYTDRYNETILSYANNINTSDGGYHLVGLARWTMRIRPARRRPSGVSSVRTRRTWRS